MSNKYLTKIAEQSDKKQKPYGMGTGAAFTGGGLAAQVAALSAMPAVTNSKDRTINGADVRRMRKDYGLDTKSVKSIHTGGTPKYSAGIRQDTSAFIRNLGKTIGPFAMPKGTKFKDGMGIHHNLDVDVVNLPHKGTGPTPGLHGRNATIAMHEFGHIQDFRNKNKVVNAVEMASRRVSSTPLGLIGSAVAGHYMGKSDEKAKYAPAVGVGLAAPMIGSELKANYYAAKSLYKHRGLKVAKKYGLASAIPLASYAGIAAMQGGVAALAASRSNKAMHRKLDK